MTIKIGCVLFCDVLSFVLINTGEIEYHNLLAGEHVVFSKVVLIDYNWNTNQKINICVCVCVCIYKLFSGIRKCH